MRDYVVSSYQLLENILTHPAVLLSADKTILALNLFAEKDFFCCDKSFLIGHDLSEYIVNFDQASLLFTEQHELFYFHAKTKKNYTIQLDAFPSDENIEFYLFQAKEAMDYEYEELKHTFEVILNNLPGSVYWKNVEGQYLGCNKAVLQMAGFDHPNQIIGKTDYDLCWNEFAEEWSKHDELVIKTDKQVIREETVRLASGRSIVELSYKTPLKDRLGNVLGIIGTSLDISKLKEMELFLTKAKEKAEEANRAKSEFLSAISHDMKTPLSGIVTTAEIIMNKQTISDEIRKYAAIIADSGKQLASFFTSCLDLFKMEMQEWACKIEIFSLNQLAKDIISLFNPHALSKNLPLNLEYDSTLPLAVEGHRESIYRILLNLLSNAFKFTEKGQITLSISSGETNKDGGINVIFQVIDTGMGIAEDKHKVIFEKLQRLESSYKTQIEGSGIGLYIVDQYVKRLGGNIKLKSKLGEGTIFIVTIPLKISYVKKMVLPSLPLDIEKNKIYFSDKKINPSLNALINKQSNTIDRKKILPILLVEDIEVIQFVTKTLLSDAGFSVEIASSGEEALELFEPEKYGLIYMDFGLPKMTGYEAAQAIRLKEQQKNAKKITPIIALTGHGAVEVQSYYNKGEVQALLSKPLSRDQAEQIWKRYVDNIQIDIPGLLILESEK